MHVSPLEIPDMTELQIRTLIELWNEEQRAKEEAIKQMNKQ